MKYTILFTLIASMTFFKSNAQTNQPKSNSITYSYCEEEFGSCRKKCNVTLVSGERIALGSYIKVYLENSMITEGYILKHINGDIYILKNKADAKNPDVCGGCCGGAYSIDINKKQIWGC